MTFFSLPSNPDLETIPIEEIHLNQQNRALLYQVLDEFKYYDSLKKFNLPIDNKILLHGHSGCGKTVTAKAIAKALNKKILILNLGGFVSHRLGETAKNISSIFNQASRTNSVLFIDEFDSVGKARSDDKNDSGEMKRLVNAVIQLIDNLSNETLLICATNHIEFIDSAILRRFQLKVEFDVPNELELNKYYNELLGRFPESFREIKRSFNISYAEAKDLVYREMKKHIIESEKLK